MSSDELYNFDGSSAAAAAVLTGTSHRLPTGMQQGAPRTARPMTSSAGFKSGTAAGTGPGGVGGATDGRKGPAPALDVDNKITPQREAEKLERAIYNLVTESADACNKGDFELALDKAKAAGKKERALAQHRLQNGLEPNHNLVCCCYLNLANAFEAAGRLGDASKTYKVLVKNKDIRNAGRFRVNVALICVKQGNLEEATKHLRMALDEIPATARELRAAILRNLGNVLVRQGSFQDAIVPFGESARDAKDMRSAFNLLLCLHALGDAERARVGFRTLLRVPEYGSAERAAGDHLAGAPGARASGAGADEDESPHALLPANDSLRELQRERSELREKLVVNAARVVARLIDARGTEGYEFVVSELQQSQHEAYANEVLIAQAMSHIANQDFATAIAQLKAFAKTAEGMVGAAATNLSFLYFLERDYESAERHANVALNADRYNARALVNKGNCLYVRKEFERARELFIEALNVEADCTEALFNLGLVNAKLGLVEQSLHAFEKLNAILPGTPEIQYNIASLYEQQDALREALDWYMALLALRPTDPVILARVGQVHARLGDQSTAFSFFVQSHNALPSSLDTLAWLGAYCVETKMFDEALRYFEAAAALSPTDVKWRLWMGTCHRRTGGLQRALAVYEATHRDFPDDVECLRYLERICRELDLGPQASEYADKLRRLASYGGGGGADDGGGMDSAPTGSGRSGAVPRGQEAPHIERRGPIADTHQPTVPEERERRQVALKDGDDDDLVSDDRHLNELLPS